MKKTIRWIVLAWTVYSGITVAFDMTYTWEETAWTWLYGGLIIGLMISDLRKEEKNG